MNINGQLETLASHSAVVVQECSLPRVPASLHLPDLSLPLPLSLALPLLLDLVERQDLLLLFARRLPVATLGALDEMMTKQIFM